MHYSYSIFLLFLYAQKTQIKAKKLIKNGI